MSFLLNCPNCGERSVQEFRFGGEVTNRPAPDASQDQWTSYFYFRPNVAGVQQEWWNHRYGCRRWFYARRDTTTNQVQETFWPEAQSPTPSP
jgi:heterotetrameric sarcosine oxidase delta subunit